MSGEDVNEYMVGVELFENKYSNENSDSKVRVYMYNLRKKLEEYYKFSGNKSSDIFKIKRGQYNLTFIEREKNDVKKAAKPIIQNPFLILFTALLIGVLIGSETNYSWKTIFKSNYCWENFFLKETNNVCVVADHVVIEDYSKPKLVTKFIPEIQNESDYDKYLEQHPNSAIKLAPFTMLSKMAPYATKALSEWFQNHNRNFSVRIEKNFELDELRNNNLIYIGQYRTMSELKKVFLSNSKVFKINDKYEFIARSANDAQKIYETNFTEYEGADESSLELFVEYAIVSFMPLESSKKAIFYSSNHDIGVMATVRNFTDPNWLKKFYEENQLSEDGFFNALFEVKGVNRTELSCRLVEIERIEY